MQLSVLQPNLSKAIGAVARAVSSRTTMPVLGNILMEAKDGQLRLAATNRNLAISCWIDANIQHEGAITIPARLLSEFINSLPPDRVDMDLNTRLQTLRMFCARFDANVKGIDAFEFPLVPTYQPEKQPDVPTVTGVECTVTPDELISMIDKVAFAASQDENRPTLTGIETKFGGGQMAMAATDGYRLSVCSVTADAHAQDAIIVPSRNLAEVARIVTDAISEVTVVVSEQRNQILFSAAGDGLWRRIDVVSELIDARFPDYMATVPKMWNTRITVATSELLKAVRVGLLFARDNANIVRLRVVPEDNLLRISAASGELGNNTSELVAGVEGEGIEIAMNAKYMIDALSQIDTPQVVLEMTQPTRPMVMRMPDNNAFLHVIMPMHPPK